MSIHRQTDIDSFFGHLNILLQSEGKIVLDKTINVTLKYILLNIVCYIHFKLESGILSLEILEINSSNAFIFSKSALF